MSSSDKLLAADYRWPRIKSCAIVAAVCLVATFFAGKDALRHVVHRDVLTRPQGYSEALLSVNYFDLGLSRRALNGTIARAFEMTLGTDSHSLFHLFSILFLAVPVGILLAKLAQRDIIRCAWLAVVLLISPQTFRGWAPDLARGDMMNIGFVAWSAVLAASGKYRWATVPLAVGLLGHETAMIYGAPLLLALVSSDKQRALDKTSILLIVALLTGETLLVLVAQHLFGAPRQQIAQAIMASGAIHPQVDFAAYFAISGVYGIIMSQCAMLSTHIPAVAIPGSFLVTGAYCIILLPTKRSFAVTVAAAAFLPMTFMMIAAVDYGRWTMLSVMNAGLCAMVLHLRAKERITTAALFAAVISFMIILTMRQADTWFPSDMLVSLEKRLFGTVDVGEEINRQFVACAPDWRRLIEGHRSPGPPGG